MGLIAEAENAQDAGAFFSRFLTPLPEHATEITALVAKLYDLASSLRGIDFDVQQYSTRATLIVDDLDVVRTSLRYSLDDVFDYFDDLGELPGVVTYRDVWKNMSRHFFLQSGNALSSRLGRYQSFLAELVRLLKR